MLSIFRLLTRNTAIAACRCCFVLLSTSTSYARENTSLVVTELVNTVRRSVVSIYMRGLVNSEEATHSSGPPAISEQVGTGIIVTPEEHIVTNKHVVNNAYHV
jgi:S1-C subfamily serine protease